MRLLFPNSYSSLFSIHTPFFLSLTSLSHPSLSLAISISHKHKLNIKFALKEEGQIYGDERSDTGW